MRTDRSEPVRVSVIIPTLNAGTELTELITRLNGQTVPPHEIIVADSASEDGTAARARHAGAIVLDIPRREFNHGGTRNRAAAAASGDVLMFMTQDALPHNERLIEELTAPLRDPLVAYAYARQLPRADAGLLERTSRTFNYPPEPARKTKADIPRLGLKTFFCSNVCSAIRKDVFEEMGRFPEPVMFNEDLFMAARCILHGYAIVYAAKAEVVHSHDYTALQQLRRFYDNGVSMREQDWILPYAKVGKEGSRLVRRQLEAIREERRWGLLPGLLLESAAKLIGFRLGQSHRKLPSFVKHMFGLPDRTVESSQPSTRQAQSVSEPERSTMGS